MIDALFAEHLEVSPDGLRVTCGPLAFGVGVAERDRRTLLERQSRRESERDPIAVPCELETRDEQMLLTAFSSFERRELYRGLRSVSGIGRRSALAVLDCGERHDILRAVSSTDKTFFRDVPGLGAKRIEAVVSTLRSRYSSELPSPVEVPVRWIVDGREALEMEGVEGSEPALLSAAAEKPSSIEQLIEEARARV